MASQDTAAAIIVAAAPGTLIEVSTEGIKPVERLSYWREAVLSRLEPVAALDSSRPFDGRLRRIVGTDADMIEHESQAVLSIRTLRHCRRDQVDDISLDMMVYCDHADIDQGQVHALKPGLLYHIDYAQPVSTRRSHHHNVGLILKRDAVRRHLGKDPGLLLTPPALTVGIGTLLAAHIRLTIQEAPRLTPAHRLAAVTAATEMALAAFQIERRGIADGEEFAHGFYLAARRLIDRRCDDPEFTAAMIPAAIGCSRASLYRLFAARDESLAAVLWATRLDRVWRLLGTAGCHRLSVAEIAFRCGFSDPPTFTRMFKRRFGLTPTEARKLRQGGGDVLGQS